MRFVVPCFLVVILLCGVVEVSGEPFVSSSGFSIECPQGWQRATEEQYQKWLVQNGKRMDMLIYGPRYETQDNQICVAIEHKTYVVSTAKVFEMLRFTKRNIANAGHGAKNWSHSRMTIDGNPAFSIGFDLEQPNNKEPIHNWVVFIAGKEKSCIVNCQTRQSSWPEMQPVFEEIVDSVELISQERETPSLQDLRDLVSDEVAAMSSEEVEVKVQSLLSAGRQSEAEDLLEMRLLLCPKLLEAIRSGDENRIKAEIKAKENHYRDRQRELFLYAVCARSRFNIDEAFMFFAAVAWIDSKAPEAECAYEAVLLDSSEMKRLSKAMKVYPLLCKLDQLADSNPDDVFIRWTAAIMCRQWKRNKEGVKHYEKMLQKWQPGPVLVHQTYANMLDGLGEYEKALVSRRKAVELEPAAWSWDGLSHTLHKLNRFEEAEEAHAEAVRLDPTDAVHWSNWGSTLCDAGQYEKAIAKCQHSLMLDHKNWCAMVIWGRCLERQGKKAEAVEKYKRVLERWPMNLRYNLKVKMLEIEIEAEKIGGNSVVKSSMGIVGLIALLLVFPRVRMRKILRRGK